MRLLTTLENKLAKNLTFFLKKEKIDSFYELSSLDDSKSDIWVKDEEHLARAKSICTNFLENPEDPRFKVELSDIKAILSPKVDVLKNSKLKFTNIQKTPSSYTPYPITFLLIFICGLFFFTDSMYYEVKKHSDSSFIISPLKKNFLYDYPEAYSILEILASQKENTEKEISPEIQKKIMDLLENKKELTHWKGLYYELTHYDSEKGVFSAPLFEKIKQGEVWRLFTPALLHGSIMHILFNMMWCFILGSQMEKRLSKQRYLLFILASGIFSNTAQYLMAGPNFIGISGVVCGMIAFVFARQSFFPWEGYLLQRSTLMMISIFVFGLFGLQVISFFSEVFFKTSTLNFNIANTAHISGGVAGFILGKSRFFQANS